MISWIGIDFITHLTRTIDMYVWMYGWMYEWLSISFVNHFWVVHSLYTAVVKLLPHSFLAKHEPTTTTVYPFVLLFFHPRIQITYIL